MDTSGDGRTGARANLLLFSFGLFLFLEPDAPSALNEVPDLVDVDEAGSDGDSFGRKGAVDYARFFRCKDPPDFCRVCSDVIGVFGQLLYLPAVTCCAHLFLLTLWLTLFTPPLLSEEVPMKPR